MTTTANPSATAVALRCPSCGRRSVTEGHCTACGKGSSLPRPELMIAAPREPAVFHPFAPAHFPQSLDSPTEATPPDRRPTAVHDLEWIPKFGREDVRGRVVIVRQGVNEPMDFDLWRWIAIPTWGIALLLAPLVIAIFVWQSFGILAAAGVALCSIFMLRFIFSDRLLQSWHLTAALNGRHVVETMPVTMIRLRLQDSRELQIRIKGQVSGGMVIEGDRVAVTGSLRSGVLHARRIHCERTGATIVPHQPCAQRLALAGLCVLLIMAVWLILAGVPWLADQAQSFRASVKQRARDFNNPTYYYP